MRILRDRDIPPQLREIPQPPEILYIEGELPPPSTIVLGVVGSRKYTQYGKEACRELIISLRGYPIAIISGLALGIDAIAHEAALEAKLTTIAFPGSGLHPRALYPAQHFSLAQRIIESGGALISELDPNERAAPWTFPKRNRLMAGYAKALLVIEAEEKSGTLITARLATEYNRDVLAIPGSIFSATSRGTNFLIRQGATPIRDKHDLLEALGFEEIKERTVQEQLEELSPQEKLVLEILSEPTSRDTIIERLNIPAHEVNIVLSILEIKGFISESFGEIRQI